MFWQREHVAATMRAAAAPDFVSHPGGELSKDYHDNHDAALDSILALTYAESFRRDKALN